MTTNSAQLPLVTVAILAYNRREPLAVTLEKVRDELDYPRDRLEVIVVDNASTDGTAEMVRERFADVGLIVSPENTGIGGWNRAFEAGSGDWFLVLDDDCYVEGDALRRAVAAAAEHGADLVSFHVDSPDPGIAFSDVYRTGLLSFWGCALLVSRRAVRELGGFDEGLFIWAHELEFTMRFFDRGYTHLLLPDVSAMHMKSMVPLTTFMYVRNMRNFGYVAAKLLQPRDAAVALPTLLVRSLVESAAGLGFIRAFPAVLRGFGSGLRVRSPVRPAVSRLYRRHHLDFGSHFRPLDRLRGILAHRRSGADPNFRFGFWNRRPELYPSTAAALRIP